MCGPKDMEVSVEMKGRTGKGFPNREQDMEYVQASRPVHHEGLFDGKHVGIQGRSVVAAFFYADSSFVFRRNRPVRTRTPRWCGTRDWPYGSVPGTRLEVRKDDAIQNSTQCERGVLVR